MSRASNSERDRSLEFRGFLNELHDSDYLSKGKSQKSRGQAQDGNKSKSSRNTGVADENKGPPRKVAAVDANRKTSTVSAAPYEDFDKGHSYLKYSDASGSLSSSFLYDDKPPDAASEKEMGNEYFKQKKFNEAIDCYSRSIAFSPTSVAFANRAMAYLKVKRYEDAENDCTEALNLDDRYVKAYSRRATARKELGKLKSSMQDSEFAMRLEPNNQELRKQYMETKSMCEEEIAKKTSGASKRSVAGIQIAGKQDLETKDAPVLSVSSNNQQKATVAIQNSIMVETVDDYDEYCHYVAGLVGLGLSKLFYASGSEDLASDFLSNSMGLFLQKTNIIRDYLEDINEIPKSRMFWPRQIWSKYADKLEDLKYEENSAKAVECLNDMVTNALMHAEDCLVYMAALKDITIFRFCAIPQVMAIGTLELCYNNLEVFRGVVKMRRGLTARVIDQTKTMADVYGAFYDFSSLLKAKVNDKDPNAELTKKRVEAIQKACISSGLLNKRGLQVCNNKPTFNPVLIMVVVVVLLAILLSALSK